MPSIKRGGRIAGLFVGDRNGQAKTSVPQVSLTLDGIDGDAHSGRTRKAGAREPAFPRGTSIANTRQISVVSVEELIEIASRVGVPRIDPGWLAASVAIEGAGPITHLPPGTIIRVPSGASIYVSELNSPCRVAARLLAQHGGYEGDASTFVRQAIGLRGVVGFVYAAGKVESEIGWSFCSQRRSD